MNRNKDSITPASDTMQRCNKAKGEGKVAWPTIRSCNKVKGNGKFDDASHELCPYFDNLPSQLTTHILLKLPIKSLLICRCVCKIWNTLISEPHFAKLQFERAPVSFVIRNLDNIGVSRNLYLLECEAEKFEIGSKNHVKLDPIFELPLCKDISSRDKNDAKFYKVIKKKKSKIRYFTLTSSRDKFGIVNSCNGLLCLSETSIGSPLVICNPVTREFTILPELTTTSDWFNRARARVQAGFGFQPKTNEYKVIIMWNKYVRRNNRLVFERVVLEIHTLGTPSWRKVEVDPQISFLKLLNPTCVNGALHWIIFETGQQKSILCFNFESERLQSFPSPPHVFGNHDNGFPLSMPIRLGELKGFLYICHISSLENVTMWVMNEYGIGESWTIVYSIDTSLLLMPGTCLGYPDPWRCGCYWLSKHHEPEKHEFKVFRIQGTTLGEVEVIEYIPSLISLNDVVKGDNVEALNTHSWWENDITCGENEVLSISQHIV
ncbi:putative F-box domain-containing protein [Medicago truncatula]|uniref:F-box protein interaction domain protein n=2 Tax=Medicago truncatula TaxID=3880 RepID=G7KDE0_MEDTR|nr:F-box protein At3g07870 isoform X1 [Medicago truncatula]XP_039690454.1 F-box protein At3g07870 isoform X1 [Medicago truncatula]AES94075.1 F-box protein interaction domain protein [Medicago truncatula]RHN53613.1 putative F-box domain-containing protein [Medicago truncatula]